MTLRRVARPRLLASHCLLENSRGCFREIALFPILLFFRFALRFGHVESCHRSTLREILKFKLTNYPISCPSEEKRSKGCMARIVPNHSAFWKRNEARVTFSSSRNALTFSSARTTKRFPSSQSTSATKNVRPPRSHSYDIVPTPAHSQRVS
jgi:hypothetical protein